MSHEDPAKWNMPGWRIEQRYGNKVLIGNWREERDKFQWKEKKFNTTNREDYHHFESSHPDVIIRRKGQIRDHGLGKDFIMTHHGDSYNKPSISSYLEDYENKVKPTKLPSLRTWNRHTLTWCPEKIDFQSDDKCINYGLSDKLKEKCRTTRNSNLLEDYDTTYGTSYVLLESANQNRFATPKVASSKVHKPNLLYKDLKLRSIINNSFPENMSHLIST